MRLKWTTNWGTSNATETPSSRDMMHLQRDVARVMAGNLTNTNFGSTAAIAESKLSFDTNWGHHHDGINSRLPSTIIQSFRVGLQIRILGNDTVQIGKGAINVGTGEFVVEDTTELVMSNTSHWVTGAEAASQTVYIYAGNTGAATLTFRFSTEAPDQLDVGTGLTFWNQQTYSSNPYRLIGTVFNNSSSNLVPGTENNFDLTRYASGTFLGTGADVIITTTWTPRLVRTYVGASATPADDQNMTIFTVGYEQFGVVALNHYGTVNAHVWAAITTAGSLHTRVSQASGTGGSFTVDAVTSGYPVFWEAWAAGFGWID